MLCRLFKLLTCLCYVLNYFSMGTTFNEGNSEIKKLPCLTACPFEAFKKQGFHYKEADFLKWTYELDDVFIFYSDYQESSKFYIKEVRSVFLGRCYMLCNLEPVGKLQRYYIYMRKERDMTGLILLRSIRRNDQSS